MFLLFVQTVSNKRIGSSFENLEALNRDIFENLETLVLRVLKSVYS